jgi:ribosomal protein S18 acetylase RimI-like enzyme
MFNTESSLRVRANKIIFASLNRVLDPHPASMLHNFKFTMSEFTIPDGLAAVRAREEDIPKIKAITNSAYAKYVDRIGKPPAPMTTDWRAMLQSQSHEVWTLRKTPDDELVGAIVLQGDRTHGALKINNVVVEPAFQGRGYGKLLLDFAEQAARTKRLRKMSLFTNVLMYENMRLYPKLGFTEVERKHEDGYDRVYYIKELGGPSREGKVASAERSTTSS